MTDLFYLFIYFVGTTSFFLLIMQLQPETMHPNFEEKKKCFASFVKVKWLFTLLRCRLALIFEIVITFQQSCLSAIIRYVMIQVTLYLFYRGRLFPFHYLCLGISPFVFFYLVLLHYFLPHFNWVEVL